LLPPLVVIEIFVNGPTSSFNASYSASLWRNFLITLFVQLKVVLSAIFSKSYVRLGNTPVNFFGDKLKSLLRTLSVLQLRAPFFLVGIKDKTCGWRRSYDFRREQEE